MTNSTIDDAKIILFDNWPGVPDQNQGVPIDGFTGADHHNVASPKFGVGTKVRVYDNTNKGYATFIYLQYIADATKVAVAVLAARHFVAPDISEQATATTSPTYFKVGDAGNTSMASVSNSLGGSMLAVALSAMTNTYYGWFWCGGVCPVDYVSGLGGSYVTNGSVAAGGRFIGVANASATGTTGNGKKIILKAVALSSAASLVMPFAAGLALISD